MHVFHLAYASQPQETLLRDDDGEDCHAIMIALNVMRCKGRKEKDYNLKPEDLKYRISFSIMVKTLLLTRQR